MCPRSHLHPQTKNQKQEQKAGSGLQWSYAYYLACTRLYILIPNHQWAGTGAVTIPYWGYNRRQKSPQVSKRTVTSLQIPPTPYPCPTSWTSQGLLLLASLTANRGGQPCHRAILDPQRHQEAEVHRTRAAASGDGHHHS